MHFNVCKNLPEKKTKNNKIKGEWDIEILQEQQNVDK